MLGQEWYSYQTLGFAFALLLALWAIFSIAQSKEGPLGRAIWIVIVLFIPYLGFLAWLFLRAKEKVTFKLSAFTREPLDAIGAHLEHLGFLCMSADRREETLPPRLCEHPS